jgi:hypothetical protein
MVKSALREKTTEKMNTYLVRRENIVKHRIAEAQ